MSRRRLLISIVLAAGSLLATTTPGFAEEKKAAVQPKTLKKAPKAVKRSPQPSPKTSAKGKPAVTLPPVAIVQPPSTDVYQRLTKAGDYRYSIQHQGLTRTYRVHVPQRYVSSEPAPLLVALHGGGIAAMTDDGLDTLVRESEREGFIALFPDAYKATKSSIAAWNAGACCGEARARNVNDVGFIEQAVQNVFSQVSIARTKIYAAGFSDGGMMAYKLACDLPFVFKGVASVAGTDNTINCRPGREVSVFHLHAKNDPRVPFNGGSAGDGPDNIKAGQLTSVPDTVRKWARVDGCEPAPRRVLEKAGAYCETYSYCRRKTAVQMCVTDIGGHTWPGAKPRSRAQLPSQAISATEAMWDFLVAR
jgi:polyhydroxybutyrate depolymerase